MVIKARPGDFTTFVRGALSTNGGIRENGNITKFDNVFPNIFIAQLPGGGSLRHRDFARSVEMDIPTPIKLDWLNVVPREMGEESDFDFP